MSNQESGPDMKLFWGCFIALITTAFAFITRAFLVNAEPFWPSTFGLNQVQAGELFGAGIWPFAISIIVFSLIIDQVGYRLAMIFSFVCYALYAVLAYQAYGIVMADGLVGDALKAAQSEAYDKLYLGSVILGLGNGTVEAFINPVVATMFKKDKTKWLNILHAGWPGGLVIGGILTILLGAQAAEDWRILIYLIAIPAVIYLVMLLNAKFPVNERVSSGTSYKEMLAEFGAIGALIAGYLIYRQLGMVFGWSDNIVYILTAVSTIGYFLYCKSLGRPLLIFMCLIMIPLATTELGTDGAISGLMEEPMEAAGYNGLWVLIYTSAIMMVLRFWFAGPIVAKARTFRSPSYICCARYCRTLSSQLCVWITYDLCIRYFVWLRKNLFLAHHTRCSLRAMSEGWSTYPQCDCRYRYACGWHPWRSSDWKNG